MKRAHGVRLSDAVHGVIQLTEAEAAILDTKSFQRLHNVAQLGMASRVFPSANYSRFSHSVGVCNVIGSMLEAVQASKVGAPIDKTQIALFRMAGLLHDIGHYPFSHTFEEAIRDVYQQRTKTEATPSAKPTSNARAVGHEEVGSKIVEFDEEIVNVLNRYEITADALKSLKTNPESPWGLLSSDLDADRLDYLNRNAIHTGMPYGNTDVSYLTREARFDSDKRICFSRRALKAADHLLLSRHFDYQQVVYNKTVVGLEILLADVIKALISKDVLNVTENNIIDFIKSGTWACFDDNHLLAMIRILHENQTDKSTRLKCKSLMFRNPARLVGYREYFESNSHAAFFNDRLQIIKRNIPSWSTKFGIPEERWYLWQQNKSPTSYKGEKPIPEQEDESMAELVRIASDDSCTRSLPIIFDKSAMVSSFATTAWYCTRIYVLFDDDDIAKRDEISTEVDKLLQCVWIDKG